MNYISTFLSHAYDGMKKPLQVTADPVVVLCKPNQSLISFTLWQATNLPVSTSVNSGIDSLHASVA